MTLSTGRLSGRSDPNEEEAVSVADEKDTQEEASGNPELRAGGDGDPDDLMVVVDGVRYRKEEAGDARKRSAEAKKAAPPSNKARSASNK